MVDKGLEGLSVLKIGTLKTSCLKKRPKMNQKYTNKGTSKDIVLAILRDITTSIIVYVTICIFYLFPLEFIQICLKFASDNTPKIKSSSWVRLVIFEEVPNESLKSFVLEFNNSTWLFKDKHRNYVKNFVRYFCENSFRNFFQKI